MTTNVNQGLESNDEPASDRALSRSIPAVDAATLRRSAPAGSGAVASSSDRTEPEHAPRVAGKWGRAIAFTLGVLYVPAIAPLFLGPLGECDHCVETYYQYFPLVPGAIGFSAFALGDVRIALSMALAAAVFALVLWSLRRGGHVTRWVVCTAAVAWVFVQAMWFSLLLRM